MIEIKKLIWKLIKLYFKGFGDYVFFARCDKNNNYTGGFNLKGIGIFTSEGNIQISLEEIRKV